MKKLQKDQAKLLLEISAEAMLIIDDNGSILLANAMAEQLFAFQRGELIGL